ncbi:hypothetical protein PR048_011003 [Dryococelus australis]|uniref:Uncharacterized protein n=1 Tax=Dryococelus australis TaxID=614101 RepID=A0ABQ9HKF9_9NEOP|nr:hypothetical protein PR048_011003 [Dryococelus australis]
MPGRQLALLCMDLQKVMFVPTLTHISIHNLRLHLADTNDSYISMWHKGIGGTGGNEVASCFFQSSYIWNYYKENISNLV